MGKVTAKANGVGVEVHRHHVTRLVVLVKEPRVKSHHEGERGVEVVTHSYNMYHQLTCINQLISLGLHYKRHFKFQFS